MFKPEFEMADTFQKWNEEKIFRLVEALLGPSSTLFRKIIERNNSDVYHLDMR